MHSIADKSQVPVLQDQVAPIPLPRFDGVGFFYISEEELQELANRRGDYLFCIHIEKVRRENEIVIIEINKLPKYAAGLGIMDHGARITIEFTKTPDGCQYVVPRMDRIMRPSN